MQFNTILRALIDLTGTSNLELADYIGYHPSYISKWINGSHLPTQKTSDSLIKACSTFFAAKIREKKLDSQLQSMTKYFLSPDSPESIEQTVENLLKDAFILSRQLKTSPGTETQHDQKAIAIYGFEAIGEFILSMLNSTAYQMSEEIELRTNLNLFKIPIPLVYNSLDTKEAEINGIRLFLCLPKDEYPDSTENFLNSMIALVIQSSSPDLHISDKHDDVDFQFLLCVDKFVCTFVFDATGQIQVMYYTDNKDFLHHIYERTAYLFDGSRSLLTAKDHIDDALDESLENQLPIFISSFYFNEAFMTEKLLASLLQRDALSEEETMENRRIMHRIQDCIAVSSTTLLLSESTIVNFLREGEIQLGSKQIFLTKEERAEVLHNFAQMIEDFDQINVYLFRDYLTIYKRKYIQYSLIQLGSRVYMKKDLATLKKDYSLYYEINSSGLSETIRSILVELISREESLMDKVQLVKYLRSIL